MEEKLKVITIKVNDLHLILPNQFSLILFLRYQGLIQSLSFLLILGPIENLFGKI